MRIMWKMCESGVPEIKENKMGFRIKMIVFVAVWLGVTSFFFKRIENAKGDTKQLAVGVIGFIGSIIAGGYVYTLLV